LTSFTIAAKEYRGANAAERIEYHAAFTWV
jgi:hypothetical protein